MKPSSGWRSATTGSTAGRSRTVASRPGTARARAGQLAAEPGGQVVEGAQEVERAPGVGGQPLAPGRDAGVAVAGAVGQPERGQPAEQGPGRPRVGAAGGRHRLGLAGPGADGVGHPAAQAAATTAACW
jgi:hypothetical protein